VVDLMMPEIDGFSLCRKIREFSQVPILVLSAVNKPGITAQVLETGADDYLNKPMKSNLLVAHLNKLARRAKAVQSELVNEEEKN
jgi:two-component system KDP operon response regulator KdpE